MEQLVIIALIGLFSLVNWLMKLSAEARERQKQERARQGIPEGNPYRSPEPIPPPAEKPEADLEKLLEALGLPGGTATLKREILRPNPPALPPPKTPTPPARKPTPETVAPTPLEPQSPASPLTEILKNRESVRQAVILREVLGAPKAFSP